MRFNHCSRHVVLLLLLLGSATADADRPRIRGSAARSLETPTTTLTCRLSLFEIAFMETSYHTSHAHTCSPMVNGEATDLEYKIDVDDTTADAFQQSVQDGVHCIVTVSNATIDEERARVVLSEDSVIQVVDPEEHRKRRHLAQKTGSINAMVVRIILSDRAPDFSKSQLYQYTFQNDVSLKNQYRRCSANKLTINPTGAGVIEVNVGMSSSASSHTVINAATTQALRYLSSRGYGSYSSLNAYADLVLFVTPQMGSSWMAYASLGGGTSVFNNRWGGYVATVMHETGHNFGLLHSHEGGVEYEDYTGYMGGAMIGYHDQVNYPAECFNAVDLWELGWYSDRSLTVSSNRLLRLAAYTEYSSTVSGQHYVLLKTSNGLYVYYNRAEGMNAGTYEYGNQVIVYTKGSGGSYLQAHLTPGNNYVYGGWRVTVCSQVSGSPDFMLVSVSTGGSMCGSSPSSVSSEPDRSSSSGGSGGFSIVGVSSYGTKFGNGQNSLYTGTRTNGGQ